MSFCRRPPLVYRQWVDLHHQDNTFYPAGICNGLIVDMRIVLGKQAISIGARPRCVDASLQTIICKHLRVLRPCKVTLDHANMTVTYKGTMRYHRYGQPNHTYIHTILEFTLPCDQYDCFRAAYESLPPYMV